MLKENRIEIDRTLESPGAPARGRQGRGVGWLIVGLIVIVACVFGIRAMRKRSATAGAKTPEATKGAPMAVPVVADTVKTEDVPIYLDGLGTVQAFNTVAVRARVDGQL